MSIKLKDFSINLKTVNCPKCKTEQPKTQNLKFGRKFYAEETPVKIAVVRWRNMAKKGNKTIS
jgi:hypothetical protein